jgi:hypothetical protein
MQTIAGPASRQGRMEWLTLWAGQSVSLCHHTEAGKLMTELIAKANAFFPKC